PLYWRFSRFNTRPFDYIGQTWQVPDPPEQFLEEIYGPNWRTPDAHFDSLLSGYNRNPEASDVALCFAYNRLFDRMDRSEWKKAAGYCRQILTKKPDSFIEEVNQWLEQRIQQQGSAT
ncbi:MAG: hypothetical protein J0651_04900, partial [Actinobacteria bacterium]|nr:hypothetical protein [Actinomycetota bacterium]